jgi:hypothetical protein
MDDSEFLISQYADDSTLILEDDTQSLNQALEVVGLFSTCSGLAQWENKGWWSTGLFLILGQIGYIFY